MTQNSLDFTLTPDDAPSPSKPALHSEAEKEAKRLNDAALRVLMLLKVRGDRGAFNYELCAPEVGGLDGCRRLRELRAAGYDIGREHVEGGTWRYVYRGVRPL